MDTSANHVTGFRPSARSGRRILTAGLLAVATLLASCGGGSDGQRVTSSTGPAATDTEPGIEAGSADGEVCRVVESILLRPAGDPEAAAEWVADGREDETTATLETLRDAVPQEQRAEMAELVDVAKGYDAGEAPLDDPGMDPDYDPVAVLDGLLVWAAETCPPAQPVWACTEPATFTKIGEVIDDGSGASVPAEDDEVFATPEQAVAEIDEDGERVEVDRNDDEVYFGWLDADGLVQAQRSVLRADGGWTEGSSTTCRRDDDSVESDDGFVDIGNEIPG